VSLLPIAASSWSGQVSVKAVFAYVHPAALQVRLPYGLNGFCPVSDNLAAGAGTPPAPVKPMTSAVTSNFCTVGWFLPSRLEKAAKRRAELEHACLSVLVLTGK
jgi:hypothetical protein